MGERLDLQFWYRSSFRVEPIHTEPIPFDLSDDALVSVMPRLAQGHNDSGALLIAHLAELDGRGLCRGLGYSSTFKYCREVLHLSESESYNRIEVCRVARRFPIILDRLATGSLNLTTVRLLGSHLTEANHRELLEAASRRSKEEVEALIARLFPRPDVPSSIRKLPAARPAPRPEADISVGSRPPVVGPGQAESGPSPPIVTLAALPPSRRPVIAALAPDRFEVRFTASASTCEKLRFAKDLLRHAIPSGDTAENIQLRCRVHNAYEAELVYGREKVAYGRRAGAGLVKESVLVPERVRNQPPPPVKVSSFLADVEGRLD